MPIILYLKVPVRLPLRSGISDCPKIWGLRTSTHQRFTNHLWTLSAPEKELNLLSKSHFLIVGQVVSLTRVWVVQFLIFFTCSKSDYYSSFYLYNIYLCSKIYSFVNVNEINCTPTFISYKLIILFLTNSHLSLICSMMQFAIMKQQDGRASAS